jgi:hypothetical protein
MPSSQEAKSTESQPSCSTKNKAEEVLKSSDGLFKEIKTSLLGLNDQQILTQFEAFMNQGQVFSPFNTSYFYWHPKHNRSRNLHNNYLSYSLINPFSDQFWNS